MTSRAADRGVVGHRVTHRPAATPFSVLADLDNPAWMADSLCAQTDPEAFYPDKGGSTRAAKQVCVSCPVRTDCLGYALEREERFGIWGGLSERERRKISRGGDVVVLPAVRICAFSTCEVDITRPPGSRGKHPKYCGPEHARYAALERQRERAQESPSTTTQEEGTA